MIPEHTNGNGCNKPARVLIVDDQPLICSGLRKMLDGLPDIQVCGEADDHDPALQAIAETGPDLVLVDITLKTSCGLELIKEVRLRFPRVLTLVISIHAEAMYAERAFRAGALGYVNKMETLLNIATAVRTVLRGEVYVSREMASQMVSKIAGHRHQATAIVDILTNRELQVFALIGEGLGPNQIGGQLAIDKSTVETYRGRIKKKLRFQDAAEMRQHAILWKHGQTRPN